MSYGVIFDMDGVLIDTVAINWRVYNDILGRYGAHVADPDLHAYVGRASREQVAMFNQHFGLQLDADEFNAEATRLKEDLLKDLTPKPGVVPLLQALKHAGVPLAVGTSTARQGMENRLRTAGIYDYFDVFVTEEDVARHKPDPEVYLLAAERLRLPAARCVVIEDAPSGLMAAHAAGSRCVVVATPIVPRRYVHNADLWVASLQALSPPDIAALVA